MTGIARVWKASTVRQRNGLPVFMGALLLFVVVIPIVSSKLESLWSSQFTFLVEVVEPACTPAGLCFRFIEGKVERTTSGYRIGVRLEGVDNVYEVARDIDNGTLKPVLAAGSTNTEVPTIRPHYDLYISFDEALRAVPASLQFKEAPPPRITLAFERAGGMSEYRTLDFTRADIGKLASLIIGLGQAGHVRVGAGLLILLLALTTSLAEAGACNVRGLGHGAFASAIVVRWAALAGAAGIETVAVCLLTVLVILLPWLAIASRLYRQQWAHRPRRPPGVAAKLIAPLWQSFRLPGRPSAGELVVLTLSLGMFAYMLWWGSSFRWSIFEERDFLEARHVLSQFALPIYGPELLLGGHTIGSSLYLFLAPVVALWNDPAALLLLNRLLFLGMAVVLWWGLRDWCGPAGALFAVFALIASDRILALSYWPIHPNFSLFFAFLYVCALLRGAVDGRRGWLIFSGLLLGILTQLHFSYFLLLPCHVVLVLLGNYDRDRWTKPLAIAVFLMPLAPFLVIDAVQGFPNISQIAQRPRFHGLYPNKPFGNASLLPLVLGWAQADPYLPLVGGPLSNILWTLTVLMIALGITVGLGLVAGSARSARMTPALAATVLFCIPTFELAVLGMGYNTRHTLAIVPALFILAGFGFAGVMNGVGPAKRTWLILPLLIFLGVRAANSVAIEKISRSEGEWAIDYRSRETIARDLAVRFGMPPQVYATKTYWWWVGWSIDPEAYADIYRRSVISPAAQKSPLTSDQYVLVTSTVELPPFLQRVFVVEDSRPVAEMYVHLARPRDNVAAPSANADTGVRLHPFLEKIDQLRGQPEGFARIGHAQFGTAARDLFLGTMADSRIKMLISTEQNEVRGRGRLRWCVDSPTLGGHYQEIKTIWRPRLLLVPESGTAVEATLASDVLGSLAYKAPRCGEAWSDRMGSWQMTFAIEGMFDQSFMPRPDLSQWRWRLDLTAPIRDSSLAPTAIAAWIATRFDR
jgi:hypothetical protein